VDTFAVRGGRGREEEEEEEENMLLRVSFRPIAGARGGERGEDESSSATAAEVADWRSCWDWERGMR
jgi:hypothetical protein